MKKFIKYLQTYNLIICSILIFSGIFSATTTTDILNSLIYLPIIFYFSLAIYRKMRLLPATQKLPLTPLNKISNPIHTSKSSTAAPGDLELIPEKTEEIKGVADIDRRIFLRLIGSAGISIFLLSIFTKKTHAAFFGSMPGPGTIALKDTAGNKIDPAQEHPTDGYEITEIDEDSDATYSYYGFLHKIGAWYIAREEKATGSYRYAKGSSNFSTSWNNRKTSVSYGYYNIVFA